MRVDKLEEIAQSSDNYVDCFVSTDAFEVADYLTETLEYDNSESRSRHSLRDNYPDFDHKSGYFNSFHRSKIEIDVIDIPVTESVSRRKDLGFMSMSKMRIYTSGQRDVIPVLVDILKVLKIERQNVAFECGERVYVQLSEFYC